MKSVVALLASAAFALGMPAWAAPAAQADTVDPSLPTQLPRTAIPHHYAVYYAQAEPRQAAAGH